MELFGFLICGKLGPAAFAATISVESDQQGERGEAGARNNQPTGPRRILVCMGG